MDHFGEITAKVFFLLPFCRPTCPWLAECTGTLWTSRPQHSRNKCIGADTDAARGWWGMNRFRFHCRLSAHDNRSQADWASSSTLRVSSCPARWCCDEERLQTLECSKNCAQHKFRHYYTSNNHMININMPISETAPLDLQCSGE